MNLRARAMTLSVAAFRDQTTSIMPVVADGCLTEMLDALRELGPASSFERFGAALDKDWIERALDETNAASVRKRRLPAEQVVWLVLGMALFADRSIKDVVAHLDLVVKGSRPLAPSAIAKARYRIGAAPLEWLFERICEKWSQAPGLGGYHDLAVYGLDGSHLRVPDSDENFEHFGKPSSRNGTGDAGYPQARVVILMNLSNRLLASGAIGPWSTSEQELAEKLWRLIPDNSITIVDRGHYNYLTFLELAALGENRHFLIRAKSNSAYEPVEELADGSVLALIQPNSLLRWQIPELPGPIEVRVIDYENDEGHRGQLITTLTDAQKYPATELIELYHDRWELEIGFDEFKTHMLERNESVRSKKAEGVYQEIWGQLILYNLVRREMLMAAAQKHLPPKRISFKSSLLWMRNFWLTAWQTSPGTLPKKLVDLRDQLDALVLPERRSERRYPRHVKIKMSNYARNRGRRPVRRGARKLRARGSNTRSVTEKLLK